MGQMRKFRQRIQNQASSIEGKGFLEYLTSNIKARREISLDEACLITGDVKEYLDTQLFLRPLGQIEIPAIAGAFNHRKCSRQHQSEKLINLTLLRDDDVELMKKFGITSMQNGSLARVIEEANFQDSILDRQRLQVLFSINCKAIQNRLRGFWEQGCILPLSGMKQQNRDKMHSYRATIAIERYLNGEVLPQIQRDMAVSDTTWKTWWKAFRQSIILAEEKDTQKISEKVKQPLPLIKEWVELYEAIGDNPQVQQRLSLEQLHTWEKEPIGRTAFLTTLQERHGFSPAAAEDFIDEVHELGYRLSQENWKPGEVGYIAISSDEGPGKSLVESELVFCHLEYLTPEDWEQAHRDRSSEQKWERIRRFSTQAYYQGATLTQPDLAFLIGISVEAIRKAIKDHSQIHLPTRGNVTDMGPTISHAEKIIRLWMDGYTETEIVRRTNHSYESIERYLYDFARVVFLQEKGLPNSAIRTVMGSSRKVVERYVNIYNEFKDHPDGWRLGQLRRMGERSKKKLDLKKGR